MPRKSPVLSVVVLARRFVHTMEFAVASAAYTMPPLVVVSHKAVPLVRPIDVTAEYWLTKEVSPVAVPSAALAGRAAQPAPLTSVP